MNKLVIGLTGGIASGKTLAAEAFKELNIPVIDADEISRDLTSNDGPAHSKLKKIFPEAYPDGVFSRLKLKSIVFGNNAMLKKLNAVMHPLIEKEAVRQIKNSPFKVVVLSAPLLFETGFNALANAVITISCDKKIRIERLLKRDGITLETAEAILAAQFTDAEREARADYTIRNDAAPDKLLNDVKNTVKEILKSAQITG